MSTELQRLIISPRDRSNPRLPRQIDAQARKGIDPRTGVAYNLIHPDDYATFRVLSDQEVDRELRYSLDMSKNHVYNWQGYNANGSRYSSPNRKSSPGTSTMKFIPPKLGTISRQQNKVQKQWDKQIKNATSRSNVDNTVSNGRDSRMERTINSLVMNSRSNEISNDLDDNRVSSNQISQKSLDNGSGRGGEAVSGAMRATSRINQSSGPFHADDANHTLLKVVETMKEKYVQNIKVVDKLYDEKKSMEKRIELLERQILRLNRKRKDVPQSDGDDDLVDSHEDVNEDIRGSRDSDNLLTAEEIAMRLDNQEGNKFEPKKDQIFDDVTQMLMKEVERTRGRSSSARPRSAHSATSNGTMGSFNRSRSNSSIRRFSISPGLQADQDRYNQKMALIRSKEAELERENKEYELSLREKLLRASTRRSSDIDHMLERQAQLKKASDEKKKTLQKTLEDESQEEIRKQIELKRQQLNKPVIKHEIDWKEFALQEEIKRKQRIEQRKQEVAMNVSVPSGLYDLTAIYNSRHPSPARNEHYRPFKATVDPEKIASTLQFRQKAWEEKLNRTKQTIRLNQMEKNEMSMNNSYIQSLVKSMQDRQVCYDEKRRKRAEDKRQKEEMEKTRKIEEERLKYEKLMKVKTPDARKTHVSEIRISKVRQERESKEEEVERKRREQERKEKSAKEASVVVSTIIQQREYERKQRAGGFVELSNINEIAAEKAASSRREMREKMRKQKREIEEAKSKQPSLIERYEQDQTKRQSRDTAIQKVAEVAKVDKSSKKVDSDDNLDIFSDKERLLLQL